MKDNFYKQLQKDIEEFEKKYPGKIYSPEAEKKHKEILEKWKQK